MGRWLPSLRAGESNDVAGVILGVLAAVYGIVLAFVIVALYEEYRQAQFRRLRTLYPLIYRNGSGFTHPTTHGVSAFVSGEPPGLTVGDERPLERDLALIASGILALGLAVAVTATPALQLTYDEISAALAG